MNRTTPFLNVFKGERGPRLQLHWGEAEPESEPLTEAGCHQVGRRLFEGGAAAWLWSSSRTEDVELESGGCLSVEELVDQGWNEAQRKAQAKTREVKARLVQRLLGLVTEEFRAGLPEDEREALKRLEA